MKVLSLFDGISCGKLALDRANISVSKYYSSEIKKSAITVSQDNHKDIIRIGDINKWREWDIDIPDLIIGGSPCQDFSVAKMSASKNHKYGLEGEKSSLFYVFLEIINYYKAKNKNLLFLLENVRMKKESKIQLDDFLKVNGFLMDSKYFSYQTRARYYWTNISFSKNIIDKDINFQDFIGVGDLKECIVNKTPSRIRMWNEGKGRDNVKSCTNITNSKKIGCIMRKQDRAPNSGLISYLDFCRYLSRNELEIGQNLPVNYTKSVSYNQAQDVIGDCWTIGAITHIFKGLHNGNI